MILLPTRSWNPHFLFNITGAYLGEGDSTESYLHSAIKDACSLIIPYFPFDLIIRASLTIWYIESYLHGRTSSPL